MDKNKMCNFCIHLGTAASILLLSDHGKYKPKKKITYPWECVVVLFTYYYMQRIHHVFLRNEVSWCYGFNEWSPAKFDNALQFLACLIENCSLQNS